MSQVIQHLLEGPLPTKAGNESAAAQAARERARGILAREGLPTRRKEGWRYMDLSWLAEGDPRLSWRDGEAERTEAELQPAIGEGTDRIVIQGGRYVPELSAITQGSLEVVSLGDALATDGGVSEAPLDTEIATDGFAALNAAVAAEGAVIRVAKGDEPVRLEIHFLGSDGNGAAFVRNGIELAAGTKAQIVERHYGASGATWTDSATITDLGEGAELALAQIVEGGNDNVRTARNICRLKASATLTGLIVVGGGQVNRDEFHIALEGEGAAAHLKGLTIPIGKSVADIVTRVDHRMPHCKSDQLFRAVADTGARAAFQGAIHVAKDAQKTDARQKFDGLLLNRKAEIDAKPELLIYADDVICAHGATIGELDEDALFYLASRGLGPKDARDLLTAAFARQVLQDVGDEALRDHLLDRVDLWLREGGEQI